MLDAGSSLCKPLGKIAVDEIWIKLHLTKVSLVQSVKYTYNLKRLIHFTAILGTLESVNRKYRFVKHHFCLSLPTR